jgi:GT2 family glycosyltransferase
MKPLVCVVIVIWNGVADTLECLRSLAEDSYPNKEVLLVDNGSSDDSVRRIREEGFVVTVLSCPMNLGFTGGNNVGLAEARRRGAAYAFLLNNDTTVVSGALAKLVNAAENLSDAGVLSPVVHYYDTPQEVWFSGAKLSLARGEAVHQAGFVADAANCLPVEGAFRSEWVSGCAMLVRMDAVGEVGGFDDRYYLTWEDVDWCIRMRQADWEVLVVPSARIHHKCGRSGVKLTGVHRYYAVRNSLLLASKHAGFLYLSALVFVLARHVRGSLAGRGSGKRQNLVTVFEGFKDHLIGSYGRRPSKASHKTTNAVADTAAAREVESISCASSR